MIQAKKDVYIGYIVARYLGNEPVIVPTSCTCKNKKDALLAVCDQLKIAKTNVACEIIDKGVKKVTIKWQAKSHGRKI